MPITLEVDLAPRHPRGLRLRNPVMVASGTFGWGTDYGSLVDVSHLGAIVTNGTTLESRAALPAPRVAEVPAGLLNAVGRDNPGIGAVVETWSAAWERLPTTIILNVVPATIDEARRIGEALAEKGQPAAVELDVTLALERGEPLAPLASALREASRRPLLVKLPVVGLDPLDTARQLEQAGVDALTVMNTPPAMAIDVKRRQAVLASKSGGVSGPAVKAIALYFVWTIAAEVSIPVVGVGGIATANDALEFLMAGARAVQVGSASFRNPRASVEVVDGIAAYLESNGIASVDELIGIVTH